MTTIAFDGRYLAADSLVTANGVRCGTTRKIQLITTVNGQVCAIAVAGDLPVVTELLRRFTDQYPAGLQSGDLCYDAFVIERGKPIMTYTHKSELPEKLQLGNIAALGTGTEFALGAMAAGAAAYKAVELACAFDVYSGGDISVLDTFLWRSFTLKK